MLSVCGGLRVSLVGSSAEMSLQVVVDDEACQAAEGDPLRASHVKLSEGGMVQACQVDLYGSVTRMLDVTFPSYDMDLLPDL